jgi:hypothetical protein
MGIGDVLKIAFFVLLILALALAIANYIQQASQPPKPVLAMNIPAGLVYKGPDTTALAGWYCIENINSTNYYSIQLNAWLDNGLRVQNTYGPSVSINGAWQPALVDNVWVRTPTEHQCSYTLITRLMTWSMHLVPGSLLVLGMVLPILATP